MKFMEWFILESLLQVIPAPFILEKKDWKLYFLALKLESYGNLWTNTRFDTIENIQQNLTKYSLNVFERSLIFFQISEEVVLLLILETKLVQLSLMASKVTFLNTVRFFLNSIQSEMLFLGFLNLLCALFFSLFAVEQAGIHQ